MALIVIVVVESEVDTQLSNWLADWVNVLLLLLLLLQVYRTKHDIYIPYICMYIWRITKLVRTTRHSVQIVGVCKRSRDLGGAE